MVERIVRKIQVEVQYIPGEWANKVFFDEMEKGVLHGVADQKDEIELSDLINGEKRFFLLRQVPLDTPMEGYKALFFADVYERTQMTRRLVSLEQVVI